MEDRSGVRMSLDFISYHHGAVPKGWCMCGTVMSARVLAVKRSVSGALRSPDLQLAYAVFLGRVLAEYCPKLRSLKVKHCHNVAESSLSILRSRGVELDVEPPLQRALVLLQDVVGFAPFINLQI